MSRTSSLFITLLAANFVTGTILVPSSPARAADYSHVLPNGFSAMVVDSANQRVLISSNESGALSVMDFDGGLVKGLTNLPDASGMAIVGDRLYLALRTAGRIQEFNLKTLEPLRSLGNGVLNKPQDLVWAGGRIWVSQGKFADRIIYSVDPSNGLTTKFRLPPIMCCEHLTGSPYNPDLLLGWLGEGSTEDLQRPVLNTIDVSGAEPRVILSKIYSDKNNLLDVAATPDGEDLLLAFGQSSSIQEVRISDLEITGKVYPTRNSPSSVTVTPGQGGLVAGGSNTSSGGDILLSLRHTAGRLREHNYDKNGVLFRRSLAFSPNGSRLFSVSGTTTGSSDPDWELGAARFHADRTAQGKAEPPAPSKAWAWGYGGLGELGLDPARASTIPQPVSTNPDFTSVGTGYLHSVGRTASGQVKTWGYNAMGQLGDGTLTTGFEAATVPGLSGVSSVSAGLMHTLALKTDGTVWSWGWNVVAQLGDGTLTDRTRPVQVNGLTDIIEISAGALHNLALKRDGTVWAWGFNALGELGDGTTTNKLTPVQIPNLTGVRSVSAGGYHGLAVKEDGGMFGWGWNLFGQLGNGTTTDSLRPVRVATSGQFKNVSAGYLHSLALRRDESVLGWGWNAYGQLGDGTLVDRNVPTVLKCTEKAAGCAESPNSVASISAGGIFSLMIAANGSMWGFGFNYGVQFQEAPGEKATYMAPANKPVPVADSGGERFNTVAAGFIHSLALGAA